MTPDKIKVYAKAAGGFFATFAMFCGALALEPSIRAVFPASWIAVLAAIGAAGTIGALIAAIPNKATPGQITKAVKDLGADVVQQAIDKANKDLPKPVRDHVSQVSEGVDDLVDRIIRDIQDRKA